MREQVWQAGRRYLRLVLILAAVLVLLCAGFAFLYAGVIIADLPYVLRRAALYRVLSMGLIFTAALLFCGWFFRSFIRYELRPDCLRISKGRFLRVIDLAAIRDVSETFAGRRYRKRYQLVLKNGTVLPVNPYIEDADGFAEELRSRLLKSA